MRGSRKTACLATAATTVEYPAHSRSDRRLSAPSSTYFLTAGTLRYGCRRATRQLKPRLVAAACASRDKVPHASTDTPCKAGSTCPKAGLRDLRVDAADPGRSLATGTDHPCARDHVAASGASWQRRLRAWDRSARRPRSTADAAAPVVRRSASDGDSAHI